MSRNNSPDRTVRLNTALNTALIKNELNKIRYARQNAITIHNIYTRSITTVYFFVVIGFIIFCISSLRLNYRQSLMSII